MDVTLGPTTEPVGLSSSEAAARLATDGPNRLPVAAGPSVLRRIGRQLAAPLVLTLVVAGVLTVTVLGDLLEGLSILAIVVLNVAIETRQEVRSEAAIEALADLTAPMAKARRDGVSSVVPAADLVVGDVVDVAAGDRVPADARLVDATDLAVDESMLTGESLPVDKVVDELVFAGTLVVRGTAVAEVTATGAHTALGAIAHGLEEPTEPPLVGQLRRVAAQVGMLAIALGVVLASFAYVRSRGEPDAFGDAVLAGVAMAIAAVPEGLSTVVLTALALGAQRMAKRGAIVRRLAAVEAIGSATVLCTDKTGTITTGRLSVVEVAPAGDESALWRAAVRCNDARDGTGDPLDVALLEAAARADVRPSEHREASRPFSAEQRSMSTVHRVAEGETVTTVKGAPEVVLPRCRPGEHVERLTPFVDEAAGRGLRVLALAERPGAEFDGEGFELVGLIALGDPLRESAPATVAALRDAGIHVVMVTGDHAVTARSIATSAGLVDGDVVAGADLADRAAPERAERLRGASVVARVDPAIKRELIDAHREAGHIVAMTGDGVNDAPALRRADVGIAIAGDGGTDVAREAADLVITDGDLGTIALAVREGRRIFRNLVHSVIYLLAGNLSEAVVVIGALLTVPELAVPLLPVQLLWVNLVTDGLPGIALGVDEPPTDPLTEPPRPLGAKLLGRAQLAEIGVVGVVAGLCVLGAAQIGRALDWTPTQVRTLILMSLLAAHLSMPYIVRARRFTFERDWADARGLLVCVGGSLALQLLVTIVPLGRRFLGLAALPPVGWLIAVGCAVVVITVLDIVRAVRIRRSS